VIADYDSSAVRLVDFVNKRATHPLTKSCPIIPTIILLYESNEREAMEHLRLAGGVTKIVKYPFKTKDLLYTVLDVLTTQRKVEETFRALTKKKIISSKYPYMPIFDNGLPEPQRPEPEQKEIEKTARRTVRIADHESLRSGGTLSGSFASHHEQRVEEIEDGTDCSSLLPEFVKRIRKQQPEMNSPYRAERQRREANGDFEEDQLDAEAAERHAWRARMMSRDAGGDDHSIDSSIIDRPNDIITSDDLPPPETRYGFMALDFPQLAHARDRGGNRRAVKHHVQGARASFHFPFILLSL
jgi:hypothetical protein